MSRRRIASGAALAGLVTAAIVAGVSLGRPHRYVLRADLRNVNGLIKGYTVRIGGAPVGKVTHLELDKRDHVLVEMKLDQSAGPVGRDAKVTVKSVDLFGEKFVDLDPGDTRDPAPSGTVISPQRTFVSVDMDDVINSLDTSTRDALAVFLDESGTALVGRGRDLGDLLRALPPSLDGTGKLLAALGQDNRALGRLVEESDRVIGSVARERGPLGRLVANAGTTLDTLGRRRRDLGETVRRAPATLASARRALATLQGAAIPLAPAARGLRATAAPLTAALRELPGFAATARPTLRTARDVAPALGRLGRQGTPVVRRLRPLTTQLSTFADAFDPSARVLDAGWPNQLGLMEGWSRSTQGYDAASHIFRFGAATVDDPAALQDFLSRLAKGDKSASAKGAQSASGSDRAPRAKPRSSQSRPAAPPPAQPRLEPRPPSALPGESPKVAAALARGQSEHPARAAGVLLDYLLRP